MHPHLCTSSLSSYLPPQRKTLLEVKMMKLRRAILTLALCSALASYDKLVNGNERPSLTRFSHALRRNDPRPQMTCDMFPRLCRAKGSQGPDCCRRQCVNVKTDDFNCGRCGQRCRFGEACCGGKCVNVVHDHKNCGSCMNKCKRGSFCQFGMCSYA